MISFDHINDYDRLYQFLNNYFRWLHNKVYYKEIQVVGLENLPPKGYPVFAISNHHNAVMDPLAMLYMYPDHRQPVFIARGDIFKKNDFIAKLLRFLKILPTFRTRDGDREDVKSNLSTFDLAARILNEGGTLTMFPEAAHQQGKYFATFKKGFPRIAFRAAEISDYNLDFKILPMYIYYTEYFNMGAKQVIVIGEPFSFNEFYELYKTEPNNAYLALNAKAREAVRAMGVDVTDHEHYAQHDMVMTVCRARTIARHFQNPAGTPDWNPKHPLSELLADKELVEILDGIRENEPPRFAQLMEDAAEYRRGLEQLNLRDWEIEKPVTAGQVLLRGLLLLVSLPLFLFGFINNFVPFNTSRLLTRKLEDRFFSSSIHFVFSSVIMFPLCYIALFIIVLCLTKWWIALLYVLLSALLMPFQYRWKRAWIKFVSACRFRRYERSGNPTLARLKELRAKILSIVPIPD